MMQNVMAVVFMVVLWKDQVLSANICCFDELLKSFSTVLGVYHEDLASLYVLLLRMTWLAFRWRVQGLRLLACNVYWNAISGTHTQAHRMGACCTAIFLYADDVVFWHHLTVHCMQSLVNVCMTELQFLDMADNTKKSACMRFGSRYTSSCGNVVIAESPINWVTSARYLGVYLESSVRFKCSMFICQ